MTSARSIFFLLMLLLLAAPTRAQDSQETAEPTGQEQPGSADASASGAEAADEIATLLKTERDRLASQGEPGSDPDRVAWRNAIMARITVLEELQTTHEWVAELARQLATVDERTQQLEEGLAAEEASGRPPPVELTDLEELADYQSRFEEASAARDEAQADNDRVVNRVAEAQGDIIDFRSRGVELQAELSRKPGTTDLDRYQLETTKLGARSVSERVAHLEHIVSVVADVMPMLQLTLDLASRNYRRASDQLDEARAAAAAIREVDAQKATEEAEAARLAAEREADPIERFRQRMRAEGGALYAEISSLEILNDDLQRRTRAERDAIEQLDREEKRVDQRMKLRKTGRAEVVLRAFDRAARSRKQLEAENLENQITIHADRMAEVLDRVWDLQLPRQENPELLQLMEEAGPDREDEALETFSEEVEQGRGLIRALRNTLSTLEIGSSRYDELATATLERRQKLDELLTSLQARLYWRRSAPMLLGAEFLKAGDELKRLWHMSTSSEVWSPIRAVAGERSSESVALGLLLLAALGLHRTLRRALASTNRGRSFDEVRYVFLAGTWMLSLPSVFFLASRIAAASSEPFGHTVMSTMLYQASWFIGIRRGFDLFLSPGGYALRTEIVRPAVAKQLLEGVHILAAGAVLVRIPADALRLEGAGLTVLPRLLDVGWLAIVAIAVMRLLSWSGPLVRQWSKSAPGLQIVLWTLFPISLLIQLTCVIMATLGYEVASRSLAAQNLSGLGVLVALSWTYVLSVRIARRLARRFRRPARDRQRPDEGIEQSEAIVDAVGQVVGFLMTLVAFIALQYFTGTVGTLVTALEETEIAKTASGDWLTAWGVVLAVLSVASGHIIAAQTSRVYEQIVIPLVGEGERGARFALLTLFRYGVVLVAWIFGLTSLGLSMENVAWLMTAVSVGLGFGLQEVVANFVSGLILLFERPVRVGDVITVGQTGGTVDQIQIRATVVTNWERQTIIIPNKALITQNLTNWTRTDRVVRRSMALKVAYGADIEEVIRIADGVVRDHANVLEDPPHCVWFNGFGEYSLDFEIWFFTQFEDGLSTRSALYRALNAALKKAGIEIPLPQRQVQVRDGGEHDNVAEAGGAD